MQKMYKKILNKIELSNGYLEKFNILINGIMFIFVK